MTKQHFQYSPGDQVLNKAFDPPIVGIVTAKHDEPDTYLVRLKNKANDVVIHARNLQMHTA